MMEMGEMKREVAPQHCSDAVRKVHVGVHACPRSILDVEEECRVD